MRDAGLLGPDEELPIILLNPDAYTTSDFESELDAKKQLAEQYKEIVSSVDNDGIVDGYLEDGNL